MAMLYQPFADALCAAGVDEAKDRFYYQDYLYQLLADGSNQKPITEQQWEAICDMQGDRKLIYASNGKWAVENFKSHEACKGEQS